MAILMKIECDTLEHEVQEFNAMFTPKNIYDDVAALIEEVGTLNTIVGDLDYKVNNIELKALMKYSRDITDDNLDDLKGEIIFGYGNNCLNRPNGANGYLINIPHCKSPSTHNTQIWITRPKAGLFIRNMEGGAWTVWTPIYSDSGWQTLPLASGVSQQNESVYPCRYRRLGNVVYVEGAVRGFTEIQKVVATLPEGYRPSKSFYVQTATNAGQTDTFMFRANGAIERMATTRNPQSADDYHFVNASFLID
jgi:hypothetical protein